MKAVSIIYRTLTQTEFKAINDLIQSSGGGSQTYIDFPKGSVSDANWIDFLGFEGESVSNGHKWVFNVHSLSIDSYEQEVEISCRRDTTNSLREQNKNRIAIWSSKYSSFPSANDIYDEENNPICVFLLRDENGDIWAGWYYVNSCDPTWHLNIELAAMFFNKKKGACGYIKLSTPVPFDKNNHTWPFIPKDLNIINKKSMQNKPLQQIYYGAPGTGKSRATNDVTSKYPDTVRTTFHPDSDYSTFVGAYKPTMTKVRKAVVIGQDEKEVKPLAGNSEWDEKIAYKFVKQAFLKAYVKAWKLFKKTCVENVELAPQFLIIEEINRGNCAQIFGDLFQLLDRKQNFSEYPIEADADICKALLEEDTEDNPSFGAEGLQLTDEQKVCINNVYDGKPVAEKICKGEVLVLPPNLYIWATMNTSDQSLFPIDSAFKRRWEWKYMKIKQGYKKDEQGNIILDAEGKKVPLSWKIEIKDEDEQVKLTQDWWQFIQKINSIIASMTSSADKQLGYFFCKADKDGVISGETFVSKVIFYLWNDVFKDYGFEDASLFRYKVKEEEKEVEKDLTFPDFYDEDGEKVNAERLVDFIQKVMDWQKPEENV